MGNRRRGRIMAFQALYWWDVSRPSVSDLLGSVPWNELTDDPSPEQEDSSVREFAQLLIAGALENVTAIDAYIKSQLRNWDFSRLARVDLAILRMSVYALVWQADIPANVTIDEAVDIAREFGGEESYRFVNGVLDGIRKGLPT